ncbi:MAG TPA: hypothetical protein VMT34_15435 [Aggregatilineales bacterium]|nr:hypothetical protein [Aggregatilineales bacterium]
MEKRQVIVRMDDRVRLISAVLAATTYPDRSQEHKKHGTHPHARATRKLVGEFGHHPAVHAMQVLVDQGLGLPSMVGYVLRLSWPALEGAEMPRWVPPRWDEHLRHFYEITQLAKLWADEDSAWQPPLRHLREAFSKVDLVTFLEPFVGPIPEKLVFMPNISYPTDQTIGLRVGGELIAIMPPPLAWGDSAPWPYKDDEALAYRVALTEYLNILLREYMAFHADAFAQAAQTPLPVEEQYTALHPHWDDQFRGLLRTAAIALFLEQSVSSLEAKSYMQYMQKLENLTVLPGMVAVMRHFIEESRAGRYGGLVDFLPSFPQQLREALSVTPRETG